MGFFFFVPLHVCWEADWWLLPCPLLFGFVVTEPTRTAPSQTWTCSAGRSPSSAASTTPASSSLSGRVWTTRASLPSSPSTSPGARCSPCCTNRRGEELACKNDDAYTVTLVPNVAAFGLWLKPLFWLKKKKQHKLQTGKIAHIFERSSN